MHHFLRALILLTLVLCVESSQHQKPLHQHKMSGPSKASLNVLKGPLAFFSNSPLTGYMRNGYCEVPAGDFGNHGVAAEVTEEFLDYTEKQGNDLRMAGLTGGCKWCLCASRWKEAFDARKSDSDPVVPKVFLSASNQSILKKIDLEDLRKFAAKEE